MTFAMVVTAWIVGAIVGLIKSLIFNPKTPLSIGFNMFGGIIGGGFGFHTLGIFGPIIFDIHLIPTILGALLLSFFLTFVLNAINTEITHDGKVI